MQSHNSKVKSKWIKGYKKLYQVLSDGNIISFRQNKVTGKFMSIVINKKTGYSSVDLFVNGNHNIQYVHRLVAEAFVKNPNPTKFKLVVHKNGNLSDNTAGNLKWADKEGKIKNIRAYRKKNFQENDMFNNKLSNDDVRLIVRMFKNKKTSKKSSKISDFFNVNPMYISRLMKTKKFKDTVLQLEHEK